MGIVTILNQRRAILVQLIRACHLMVTKYSSPNDKTLCKENSRNEVCNALVLGYLVIQLRRVQLWPGDPEKMVKDMDTKSISDVIWAIRGMHEYMVPRGEPPKCVMAGEGWNSMSHRTCGCTSALLDTVECIADAQERKCLKMPESLKERLKRQREKLETTDLDASKFQRRGGSRNS